MNENSFYWHDYETFGARPRSDWPAQFAGVRTDADLNEISAPLVLHCQPPLDRLPEPEACLLTGLLPQTCQQLGVLEHAFAAAIERELAQPGTIAIGYNSIRFDDEVTRFLFWRNLIDPYAREWQNRCGRWDLLDVLRCAYALRPDGITWPRHDDGRPSFKLEHLTAANGLTHDAAHDALSDVRATIALARLLKARQPRLWDFCLKLRRKEAVIAEIGIGRPFLHVSGMYAAERGCVALVWPLAPHPTNRNELIVWDLAFDPAELFTLDAATVARRLFTPATELPSSETRLPIKTIHLNRAPVVISNLKTLSPAMAERWGIDLAQGLHHAETAARHGSKMAGIWPEVYARPESTAAVDVDEDLYGGFLDDPDRRRLQQVRRTDPERLAGRSPGFDDPRLEELLLRYRARNFPQTLLPHEQQHWLQHCAARLHHGAGGATTLAQYLERLDALGEQHADDAHAEAILGALYDWAERIAPPL